MSGSGKGPKSLIGKILTFGVGGIIVAVFLVVKFSPDTAKKIGLGFLVPPDKLEQSGEFFDCKVNRNRDAEKPTTLSADFTCTAKTHLKISEITAQTGLEKHVKNSGRGAGATENVERTELKLTTDWTEMQAGETKAWKFEMKKPLALKTGNPYLLVQCEFRYPDDFADQTKGDVDKYLQLLEEDLKKNPDKYKLWIKMKL